MTLTVFKQSEELLFIQLDGSLDLPGTCEIETSFLAYVASAKQPVIVDFSRVSFLASFGMRMIFDATKSLARKGMKLVVLKPQPSVAKVLELGGLTELAIISYEEEDARRQVA